MYSLTICILYQIFFAFAESSVGTGAGCFPSGSIVHTEEGPRDIAALKKGDRVLAADDDGKMVYSEVGSWYTETTALLPTLVRCTSDCQRN